ncbi:MAG: type III secretion protein [Planctomycetota bacterium]|nr:MAG: type III secretion protein [Planctomycetota bacterium]
MPPGTIEAFGLYLVRMSAFVLAAPLFGLSTGVNSTKVAVIAILSFALYSAGGAALDHSPAPIEFAALALRELLIGLFFAFCLQCLLVGVQVAGEIVGHDMGFAMASQLDPATGVSSGLIPRIYETFVVLALFAVDAHHWMIRALSESFRVAPVGSMRIGSGLSELAVDGFARMFAAGLTFAAPVVACLLLTTCLLGLLSRLVPAIHVFDLSFQVRVLLGLVLMMLFAPLIAPATRRLADLLLALLGSGLAEMKA